MSAGSLAAAVVVGVVVVGVAVDAPLHWLPSVGVNSMAGTA